MNEPIDLVVQDDPDPDLRAAVIKRLVAYNGARAEPERHRAAAVFAQAGGQTVGGAIGYTHWQWLFVSHLWVDEEHRGGGLGAALMARIETLAVQRGCVASHLDTYGFQAKPFYEKLGYQQFGELGDYPPGHARHFLWRRLG